jgi:hypothetical protein
MKILNFPRTIASSNPPAAGDRPPALQRTGRRIVTGAAFVLALAVSTGVAGPSQADDGVVIRDFELTRGIFEREPTGTVDSFDVSDSQGFVFARIANDGPPTGMTVVWRYEDTVHAAVDLDVGTSTGWRTWSSANLKPGEWTVELVDADGIVLAQRSFTVGTALAEDRMPATDGRSGPGFEQLTQDPETGPLPNGMPRPKPSTVDSDG